MYKEQTNSNIWKTGRKNSIMSMSLLYKLLFTCKEINTIVSMSYYIYICISIYTQCTSQIM